MPDIYSYLNSDLTFLRRSKYFFGKHDLLQLFTGGQSEEFSFFVHFDGMLCDNLNARIGHFLRELLSRDRNETKFDFFFFCWCNNTNVATSASVF